MPNQTTNIIQSNQAQLQKYQNQLKELDNQFLSVCQKLSKWLGDERAYYSTQVNKQVRYLLFNTFALS
jgi:hypothetical protein